MIHYQYEIEEKTVRVNAYHQDAFECHDGRKGFAKTCVSVESNCVWSRW